MNKRYFIVSLLIGITTFHMACTAQPITPARPAPAAAPATAAKSPDSDPLAFHRLHKPSGKRNRPPAEDGIHDPANDGTHALLAPLSVFPSLPKANSGNRIDWVQALAAGTIKPRADQADATEEIVVMDLNIVREVKGSMPDVVYTHKQHTEWLDCSNCHPGIFVPLKGANQMSMAAIMLGQQCGVCHGKVAFSISECRKCHSRSKESQSKELNPAAAAQ